MKIIWQCWSKGIWLAPLYKGDYSLSGIGNYQRMGFSISRLKKESGQEKLKISYINTYKGIYVRICRITSSWCVNCSFSSLPQLLESIPQLQNTHDNLEQIENECCRLVSGDDVKHMLSVTNTLSRFVQNETQPHKFKLWYYQLLQACPARSWHFPVEYVPSSLASDAELSTSKTVISSNPLCKERCSKEISRYTIVICLFLSSLVGHELAHYFLNLNAFAVIWSLMLSVCYNSLCGMK